MILGCPLKITKCFYHAINIFHSYFIVTVDVVTVKKVLCLLLLTVCLFQTTKERKQTAKVSLFNCQYFCSLFICFLCELNLWAYKDNLKQSFSALKKNVVFFLKAFFFSLSSIIFLFSFSRKEFCFVLFLSFSTKENFLFSFWTK